MIIVINNLASHYEAEQLVRMFCKDISVKFGKRKEFSGGEDYLYIRQNSKKIFIALKYKDKLYTGFSPLNEDKNKMQLDMCRKIYDFCCAAFDKKLKWGLLTGVRPVRLMRNLYKENKDIDKTVNIFKEDFSVSDEKIDLCKKIFLLQKDIIESAKIKDYSLYISIPFCPSRCSYCSFVSLPSKNAHKLMEQYVEKLCKEIRYTALIAEKENLNLKSIYIGGGTPTAVSAGQLKQIMQTVKDSFDLSKVLEYTVEAGRPDCTDYEKLFIIKQMGANRVSINPQTFSDEVLKAIGRKHTHQDFIDCYNTAKQIGFDSINTDLIAGLPLETVESFEKALMGCIQLKAENITVHTLTLKRASNIVMTRQNNSYSDVGKMIEKCGILKDYGYSPYYMYRQKSTLQSLENVGYSLNNHESLYNIYIMEEIQSIISCGAGGVSKVVGPKGEIKRVYNYKYPAEYVRDFDNILKRKDEVIEICRQFGFPKD